MLATDLVRQLGKARECCGSAIPARQQLVVDDAIGVSQGVAQRRYLGLDLERQEKSDTACARDLLGDST